MNANVDPKIVRLPSPAAATPIPLLPVSIEAEQGVLGSAIMHNELLGPLAGALQPEHFSEPIHQRIYDVALQLAKQGKPVTPATLRTYLGDAELADGVTVPAYLARLCAGAMPALTVPGLAREVRDLAIRRDLIELGERLVMQARDCLPSASGVDLAAGSLEGLQKIAEIAIAADSRCDAGGHAQSLIERARAIKRGEKVDAGVSTGLRDLDRATGGGFRPGTLWILAGRPRMGKSVLAAGFARKVASRGARALQDGKPPVGAQYFSLELSDDEIVARLLADISYTPRRAIAFGSIMSGNLEEEDLWALEDAQRKLGELPLTLDIAPSLTVHEIGARIRAEKSRMAKRGIRLGVAFVDYLKFIKASDRYRGNRVYEVGEISGALKQMAKAEGICIALLAQVNRAVDKSDRKDKAPNLSDLRDSGDLEADADVVVFIDRESVRIKQSAEYKAGNEEALARYTELQHKAELIVAKTRTGGETSVKLWFDASASTFAAEERGGA